MIMTQPTTVVVRASTATNLKHHFLSIDFNNLSYQKSFGVPSQQMGVRRAVRITIHTQWDKLRWKV